MKNNQFMIIIAIAIFVAIIASAVTVNLTGKAVSNVVTYNGVVNMLNKCTATEASIGSGYSGSFSCNDVCSKSKQKCVLAIESYAHKSQWEFSDQDFDSNNYETTEFITCNTKRYINRYIGPSNATNFLSSSENSLQCICCKP